MCTFLKAGYIWVDQFFFYLMGSSNSKQTASHSDKSTDQTIPIPVQYASHISPRLQKITQNIISHCHSQQYNLIEAELKTISYNLPQSPLSLCLATTTQIYECPACYGDEVTICKNCFQPKKHEGHNYTLVESQKKQICACGNSEVKYLPVTCPTHYGKSKSMESEDEMRLFKKEIKFLFDLAILIRRQASNFKMAPSNLIYLAQTLLNFVNSLGSNSNVCAKLIEEIILEKPDRMDSQSMTPEDSRTIFEEIMSFTEGDEIKPQLRTLLELIIKTDSFKDGLIGLRYKFMLSTQPKGSEVAKIFRRAGLKVKSFPQSYQRYFSNKSNCYISMPLLNDNDIPLVLAKYEVLTKNYFELLTHPNCLPIFSSILEQTRITGMLNFERYYLNNNQANQQINKIGLYYSIILMKIANKIARGPDGFNILHKMLNECFTQILNRTTNTFNRVFQRLFSILVFELFYHSQPNKKQLTNVIGALDYQIIKKLIFHFANFKVFFEEQYRQLIINSDVEKAKEKQNVAQMRIVAMDEFFIKVLANCLDGNQVRRLYHDYIHQKLGQLLSMNDLNAKNVKEYLRKITQFMHILVVTLPSSMSELILSANLEKPGKDSQILLSNLLYAMENTNSTDFKQEMEKFIENQDLIVSFIKTEAQVENKKIRYKGQEPPFYAGLSPDSIYLSPKLELQHYERLIISQRKAEKSEIQDRFFSQQGLTQIIAIYQKCAEIIAQTNFEHKKHQKELILAIQTLCNIYSLNKSQSILKIVEKINKKIIAPSVKLQAHFKYREIMDEKAEMKSQSQKKKKMLEALKEKQRIALETFKIKERQTKINLECIFCKNSCEGQPYLLAHFRYNNFYSKKILQMDAPFMEFTTCGHSAHDKCLTQMHKGEFRVWYPCILCKSITNILLPFNSSQLKENQRLEKILDFLKNFAAIYTFFFQSRKQLAEFGVNQIGGVYKLLFKTLIYSLTIYPIVNHSYFLRNQYPILKFIFDLLKFTHKKVKNLSFNTNYELKANNELTNIFYYHRYQLQFSIINNFSNYALQCKIDEYRDRFSEEMTEMFDEIYENLNDQKNGFECQVKDQSFRDIIKGLIYKPPSDLNDLRSLKKQCRSCQKYSQQFQICLLCEWSCCSACSDVRKVHGVQDHIGQTVFINGYTGEYAYLHEQLVGNFSSIYIDYLGHQVNNKKNIAAGQFTLNQNSWSKIVNDIVCNRLHKEVMRLKG